jgi:hypothetical protein
MPEIPGPHPYATTVSDPQVGRENISRAARTAARQLIEAAADGECALSAAKNGVLALAADSRVLGEMLIGELAMLGIKRHGTHAADYFTAELSARHVLSRFLPELVASSSVSSVGSA